MKRSMIILALIMSLGLAACTSNTGTNTKESERPVEPAATITATPIPTVETEIIPVPTVNQASTVLFDTIYTPYAKKQKSADLESVKTFVKSSGYQYKLENGSLIATDNKNAGDKIYFVFDNPQKTIVSISYFRDNPVRGVEIIFGAKKDNYYKNVIEESRTAASDLAEQKNYLFN